MFLKRILISLFVLLYLSSSIIYADEDFYYVYDTTNQINERFNDYEDANYFYNDNIDNYQNLVLKHNDKVIKMEYGIVEFKKNDACTLNLEYYSQSKNESDYLNACLAIDALYLSTDYYNNRVNFLISADKGDISLDDVILHPYEELDINISSYQIKNNELAHNIKTQLDYDFYSYSIKLDNKPAFLKENTVYYSYDNHYFYDDFYLMSDDYKNDTNINAVNEIAYYNYYQYLPHRSLTNYTKQEIDNYINDVLAINNRLIHYYDYNNDKAADEVNRSQLFDQTDNFFINQYLYGTNALMLLSSAIYESSYGKSLNSYINNNLYFNSAFETSKEKQYGRYDSVGNSLKAHSKHFISILYSNHLRSDYSGTNYGNKVGGINVKYSLDPYFGEKSAAAYYELDSRLSFKDYNNYAFGIIKDKRYVNFYEDEYLNNRQFFINDIPELSLIILAENEDSYKVQLDYSYSDEGLYDFEKSIAYIAKENFDIVINQDKIFENEYFISEYDFNGGYYHDLDHVGIKYRINDEALTINSYKDGFKFIGDDNGVSNYQEIKKIELISGLDKDVELYKNLDLVDAKLRVTYTNNQSEIVSLNSDMISDFNNSLAGKQTININYCGMQIEKEINVSSSLQDIRNELNEAITTNDYQTIKSNIKKIYYLLSFNQIRNFDYELKNIYDRNYVIKDNRKKYNFSISGLDLSLSERKVFNIIEDTYYVVLDEINEKAKEEIYAVADGYGFDIVDGLNIKFKFNNQNIDLDSAAIVQVGIEDKKNNLIYSVYHLNENNDVIKCRTTQSDNYIQFMILEAGDYLIMSMPSFNEYAIQDQLEDLSYENMGYDSHRISVFLSLVIVVSLLGIISIIVYYIISNKRNKLWKDFRKGLLKQESVQEEKLKS